MPLPRPFTLQPVLTLKERYEDQLQVDLAERQSDEEQQRRALADLEEQEHQSLAAMGALTSGQLDLTAIQATQAYLVEVVRQVGDQIVTTARAALVTEGARSALTTAMQERQALEKLRKDQQQELQRYLRQLEANQADETALSRYYRQSRGS